MPIFTMFFWRKISIEDPDIDGNPYLCVIWYLWKGRNDKLFRRIDRYPHNLSDMRKKNA